MSKQLNPLTPDEKYVIQGKGTERPFIALSINFRLTAAGRALTMKSPVLCAVRSMPMAGALKFCVRSATVTWGIFLRERVLPRRIFVTVLTLFP